MSARQLTDFSYAPLVEHFGGASRLTMRLIPGMFTDALVLKIHLSLPENSRALAVQGRFTINDAILS